MLIENTSINSVRFVSHNNEACFYLIVQYYETQIWTVMMLSKISFNVSFKLKN